MAQTVKSLPTVWETQVRSDHNTVRLDINHKKKKKTYKKHKHMEDKQCATEQTIDHWRHQIENKKYLEINENKKNIDPKPVAQVKAV